MKHVSYTIAMLAKHFFTFQLSITCAKVDVEFIARWFFLWCGQLKYYCSEFLKLGLPIEIWLFLGFSFISYKLIIHSTKS